jgi:cytochrome c oxidase cbb3-type subunit 3
VKKLSFVLLAVLAAVFVVRAQEDAPQGGAARGGAAAAGQKQAQAVERGRKQFVGTCAACHGEDATGGRGPDLIRSSIARHDKGGDLLGPVITGGRADRGMPGFPLNDSQVGDLVAFIKAQIALFDLHTRTPGAYPNDIPAERLATGSEEAGKAYFYGVGGCSKCHSPAGDLAGVASKYTPADLQTRLLYPSGKLPNATVTLASGEKLMGVLQLNDGSYVAIQDKDGWYHSWPRGALKDLKVEDPLAAHVELLHKYTNADMHNLFTYLVTLK